MTVQVWGNLDDQFMWQSALRNTYTRIRTFHIINLNIKKVQKYFDILKPSFFFTFRKGRFSVLCFNRLQHATWLTEYLVGHRLTCKGGRERPREQNKLLMEGHALVCTVINICQDDATLFSGYVIHERERERIYRALSEVISMSL